ncbi:MAG: phage holin family protein [Bacteroidales bacterium]|nr:phage holin family protein [Bacteroidales bacterium]
MGKESKYAKSMRDIKEYAQLQYELFRLNLLEKLSQVIALILSVFAVLVLLVIVFVHLSLALVYILAEWWKSQVIASLAVGGLFLIITMLLLVYRKVIFINPIVKQLSRILFDEFEELEENELSENKPLQQNRQH